MLTILLVEKDIAELEILLEMFQGWHTPVDILTARSGQDAMHLLEEEEIDLVVCSILLPGERVDLLLTEIEETYPTLPTIAISSSASVDGSISSHELENSHVYCKPFDKEHLFNHLQTLVEEMETENIKDIPTHSLLQILETEEKTCTLKVYGKEQSGLIFILGGVPVAAETNDLHGEFAVFEIIGWEDVILKTLHFNGRKTKEIFKPLIALIMEGFRLKDEQEAPELEAEKAEKKALQLETISTAGQKLSFDLGSRLKVEFNDYDGTYNSLTIGMLPEEYIIITKPTQLQMLDRTPEVGCHVLVKYLHMGKLCLFKSTILSIIEEPQDLFFLQYPTTIHYHDLRKTKRVKIFIPCTMHFAQGGEFFGALIDLSSEGGLCQIGSRGNKHLPDISIDETVELRCLLPGMKEEQQIHANIKNMKKSKGETHFGVEFINMHSYLQETINRYLFSLENREEQAANS